jgi:hypothetical protein
MPAEQPVVPRRALAGVAVVLGQAPRERDERLRRFATHVVGLRAGHPGVEAQVGVVERVGVADRLLGQRDLARPVRRVLAFVDQLPDLFRCAAHAGASLRSVPS